MACNRFKQDVQLGRFKDYQIEYISDTRKWRGITGQNGTSYPTFYVKGQGTRCEYGIAIWPSGP